MQKIKAWTLPIVTGLIVFSLITLNGLYRTVCLHAYCRSLPDIFLPLQIILDIIAPPWRHFVDDLKGAGDFPNGWQISYGALAWDITVSIGSGWLVAWRMGDKKKVKTPETSA